MSITGKSGYLSASNPENFEAPEIGASYAFSRAMTVSQDLANKAEDKFDHTPEYAAQPAPSSLPTPRMG